jgi:CheY-like chemotaxis protein
VHLAEVLVVKALIVDDDPHDRGLLVMAAGEVIDKHNIIEADSAEAAIDLIKSLDFNVIVIDIRLSQSMDLLEGFDVVRLAKKSAKTLK